MKRIPIFVLISALVWLMTACHQEDEILSPSRARMKGTMTIESFVTPEQAILVASKIMNEKKRSHKNSAGSITNPYICHTHFNGIGNATYYIVNMGRNEGWAIISASRACYPLLAWNDMGDFDPISTNKCGVAEILAEYDYVINRANANIEVNCATMRTSWAQYGIRNTPTGHMPQRASTSLTPEEQQIYNTADSMVRDFRDQGYDVFWATSILQGGYDVDIRPYIQEYTVGNYEISTFMVEHFEPSGIGPMIMADMRWDQSAPWNAACPVVNGTRMLTGCAPVALGQLMRYYQSPSTYDWNSMPLQSCTSTTSSFLYNIGLICDIHYLNGETGASQAAEQGCLHCQGYHTDYGDFNSHKNDIINNMLQGRPVVIRGKNADNQGHVWLGMGYEMYTATFVQRLFTYTRNHCIEEVARFEHPTPEWSSIYYNFGWGGNYNGFYSINPNIQAGQAFNLTNVFYNVYPR